MQNLHMPTNADDVIRKLCRPTRSLPPSVKRLATRCGLAVIAEDGPAVSHRCGSRVHYDATAEPSTQDEQVARGLARYALTQAGAETGDSEVQRVVAAIMQWAGTGGLVRADADLTGPLARPRLARR